MRVLFIGSKQGNQSHYQPAKAMGHKVILIKTGATEEDHALFDEVIEADIFNIPEVLGKVRQARIDACVARFEPYVPLLGVICEELGLPGPSARAAWLSRDKILMRDAFAKAGISQPRYRAVRNMADLTDAASYLGYPFLLKPVSGSKSRFIRKLSSPADLEPAFAFVSRSCRESDVNLFSSYSHGQENDFRTTFIAEEYLKGRQVTTTSFVQNGRVTHLSVCDLVTAQDEGLDAFYLITRTAPSTLSEKEQGDIMTFSTAAIRALGLDNCALHPEYILTAEGPKVLEISARLAGYRAEMHRFAFGMDLNRAVIQVALGEKPDFAKRFEHAATAVEAWLEHAGVVIDYEGLDAIRSIVGLETLQIKKEPHERYDPPPLGEKPIASFVTSGKKPKDAYALARRVLTEILSSVRFYE
jgi:biotin carboxylase